MIAPHNGRRAMLEEIGRLAVGVRLRRSRIARAYEDKEGGWTLVTPLGLAMRVTGGVAVVAWEGYRGRGCAVCELAAELALLFPRIPPEQILRDLLEFTAQLLWAGFVEVASAAPARAAGPAFQPRAGGNGGRVSNHPAE